jgi:hypothetical protein
MRELSNFSFPSREIDALRIPAGFTFLGTNGLTFSADFPPQWNCTLNKDSLLLA